jgi:hypothetical protein
MGILFFVNQILSLVAKRKTTISRWPAQVMIQVDEALTIFWWTASVMPTHDFVGKK